MTEQIQIGATKIALSFKAIKNVHLRVHPPKGRVTLSAPLGMDKEHLRVYATTKLSWIKREQQKITAQKREIDRQYITRESHYFLGKRYLMKLTFSTQRPGVILHHNKIEMIVPTDSSTEYRMELLYKWYRAELKKLLLPMVDKIAKRLNVAPNNVGIRRVKTKWGSCNDATGSIWFNIELAKKPVECIEYIVVHELMHLKERSHSNRFVMLMNKYLPGWELRRKQLNELPVGN